MVQGVLPMRSGMDRQRQLLTGGLVLPAVSAVSALQLEQRSLQPPAGSGCRCKELMGGEKVLVGSRSR